MNDSNFSNALCEVDDILKYTSTELVNRIPKSFLQFIKSNKSKTYISKIVPDIDINKQKLLKETEGFISLIYRKYWSSESDKTEFYKADKLEYELEEKEKQEKYKIDFKERKLENTAQNIAVVEYKKSNNIFVRIIQKIKKLFKK